MAANEVVWYDSSETGAPVLNNVGGSLISVLDACLKDGFNSKSGAITVTGGVATLVAAAHGWSDQRMLDVAGVTGGPTGFAGLNGRKLVTVVNANTVTYPVTGVSNGSASGTITAKRSPLGWTKPFADTNKAVYARSDVRALAQVLRIDDTATGAAAATYARATMYESMTGVDTGAVASKTGYISKGPNTTLSKKWLLVGDHLSVYIFTEDNDGYSVLVPTAFGDLVTYKQGDAYSSFIHSQESTSAIGSSCFIFYTLAAGLAPSDSAYLNVARSFNQIGSYNYLRSVSPINGSIGTNGPKGPSPVDNGFIISRPVWASELNAAFTNPIRGEFPGVAAPLNNIGTDFHKKIIDYVIGDSRRYLCVVCWAAAYNNAVPLFDITGPWQ